MINVYFPPFFWNGEGVEFLIGRHHGTRHWYSAFWQETIGL